MIILDKTIQTIEIFSIQLDNGSSVLYREYIDESGKVIDWEVMPEVNDVTLKQIQELVDNSFLNKN